MFIEPYFIWKNVCCKDYNLLIVTSNNSNDVINEFGIPYSKKLTKNDSSNLINYSEDEAEPEEFTLSLCLANDNDIALNWTPEIFNEIVEWLKSDEFEEFISFDNLDYVYYLKVTKIQKKFTYNKTGWIDVTFKPYSNYAYKKVVIKDKVVTSKNIEVFNESDREYKPLIIIENYGSNNGIIQINDLIIDGIDKNEIIYIDNLLTIVENSYNENLIPHCNRKWISLDKGSNSLFLRGNFSIEIICQFPKII